MLFVILYWELGRVWRYRRCNQNL